MQPGSFQQRRKQSWRQNNTKAKIQEIASPSGGSAKSDTGSWQTKRASSDQFGQGGSRDKTSFGHRNQAVDRRSPNRGTRWGTCSKCTPRQTSFFRRSQRASGSKPRKLRSTCSALRFARGARCIKPGIGLHSHGAYVHRSATARRASTQRTTSESTVAGPQGHAAPEGAAVHVWICFNLDHKRPTQHCHRLMSAKRPCHRFWDIDLNVKVIS